MKADLHLHTTASDGMLTPDQVVELAKRHGLSAIAITDHDTIDGYLSAIESADACGLKLIPGVEITTDFKGRECHILAYNIDPDHVEFCEMLKGQRGIRRKRADQILGKLNKMGFDLDIAEVKAESGMGTISRNHIAAALYRKRFVSTKREAFDRFLNAKGPAYVQNVYPSVVSIIKLIRDAGGVSILAHPGKYYIYEDLKYFKDNGLDGFEYLHPSHTYEMQKKYQSYADNYGMLLTGGSDFHGSRPYEEQHVGTICVSVDRIDKIIELSESRKQNLIT